MTQRELALAYLAKAEKRLRVLEVLSEQDAEGSSLRAPAPRANGSNPCSAGRKLTQRT